MAEDKGLKKTAGEFRKGIFPWDVEQFRNFACKMGI